MIECVHRVDGSATCSLDWGECDNCGKEERVRITDELREYNRNYILTTSTQQSINVNAIADRIDEEHEREVVKGLNEWKHGHDEGWSEAMELTEREYVELPKDADGVPIRVGDKVQFRHDAPTLVTLMRIVKKRGDEPSWDFFGENGGCYGSGTLSELRHYHEPTVEDVLRELLREVIPDDYFIKGKDKAIDALDLTIAEYAKRLQLKEDA